MSSTISLFNFFFLFKCDVSRSLSCVSSDVLEDLSKYYREFIPRMSCRQLTPFDQPPYADELEQLIEEKPLTLPDSEEEWDDLSIGKGEL